MKTQIAERLNTITAQNGFVPFVSRVSVIGQEQGENHVAAWREGARNLSVAVVDDESGACAVLIQATGESEEALRRHIDVVLSEDYQVDTAGPGLPVLVAADPEDTVLEENSDAATEENTDDRRED